MGSIYRSEEMVLCQLFLQSESAYDCISELGELGMVQFRDCNPGVNAFQRRYVNEVRRCDDMERQLRYFEREMKLEKIRIAKIDPDGHIEAPAANEINVLEDTFQKMEGELREINGNEERLRENFVELVELKHVLTKTQRFFDDVGCHTEDDAATALHISQPGRKRSFIDTLAGVGQDHENQVMSQGNQLTVTGGNPRVRATSVVEPDPNEVTSAIERQAAETDINFMGGTIQMSRMQAFERVLWRACRGNVFVKWEPIDEILEDPHTREPVMKAVFTVFFQGEQLKIRVKKICDGFRAKVYPCPNSAIQRRETAVKVATRIEDIKTILNESVEHRRAVLVLASGNLKEWESKVAKMKAIYHALNMLNIDVTAKCLVAEAWCPTNEVDNIKEALRSGDTRSPSGTHGVSIFNKIETSKTPPTFFRSSKFTAAFQNIVDAYGMASYREINPAPWTIISFPFLYAVMFGDFGHGFIMFLFALLMVMFENKLKHVDAGDMFEMVFGGRYLILLMGMFAIYTGFIYNDCYSKSINVFGTGWNMKTAGYGWEDCSEAWAKQQTPGDEVRFDVEVKTAWAGTAYRAGMDPIWALAENKLTFLDSFKMKMSIILGISQMWFGVFLSLLNHIHFKDTLRIWFEFIPSIIFLSFMFGYLCVLIIVKWIIFDAAPDGVVELHAWSSHPTYYNGTHCAPSLLINFINTVMLKKQPYGLGNSTGIDLPNCATNYWYPLQGTIEPILIIIAILGIPIMLFARPCILRFRHKKSLKHRLTTRHGDLEESSSSHENPAFTADGANEPALEKANGQPKKSRKSSASSSTSSVDSNAGGHGEGGEFNFGDIMIYQAIHTIEFALGCVSHTASYLRLWALSLAHAQLSDVLWTMLLRMGFKMAVTIGTLLADATGNDYVGYTAGGFIIWIFFMVFSVLTVAILILMEGLSAFLHALRLHWVEFNSKFYHGEGYPFKPFSFKQFDAAQLDMKYGD